MSALSLLALIAGAAIATQAGINARLGVLLDNALIGAAVAFFCSGLFTLSAVFLSTRHYPQAEVIRSVPLYLWFAGGAFSAFGVAMFYFLIPRMGVGPMMAYALTGQILVAMTASHFGWFDLPVTPVNGVKIVGVMTLVSGMLLINWEGGG